MPFLEPRPIACPHDQLLQRLLLGQVPDDQAEALADHLEGCVPCARTASGFHGADTLVEAARDTSAGGADADGGDSDGEDVGAAALPALIERLSAMFFTRPAPQPASDELAGGEGDPAAGDPEVAGQPGCTTRLHGATHADLAGILKPPHGPGELGRLGPYRVLKVVGAGGMGVVFQAEDPGLQRIVALKTLQPAIAACPAARARFLREARAVAAIEDEHIVAIHHVGEDDGVPFFAMQFLRGQTLADQLRSIEQTTGQRTLPVAEAVRIVCAAARGLASAHERGLIHRDIKPGNIFLNDEGPEPSSVKLFDFGLARAIDDALAVTAPGVVAGTPAYVAPEQAAGQTTDERSDLFGLGCVLYRITTGQTPLATARALPAGPGRHAPAWPRDLNPELPGELAELTMQMLAAEPAQRPASARVVAQRLAEIGTRLTSHAGPPHRTRTPGKWRTAGIAAALLMLAGLAAVFLVKKDHGAFIVETTDPQVVVAIAKAGGISLRECKTERNYTLAAGKHELPAGEYEIDVGDAAAGLQFSTRRFTIRRGDETKVTVSLRPVRLDPLDAWVAELHALPASRQVEAVTEKLRLFNPGFDGNVGVRVEDEQVVEVHIITDQVTDIRPLRALSRLEMLVCSGSESGKGRLADLTPLKGLKHLYYLACSANRIADLGPLRELPLRELIAWANPIHELRPLRGMPLQTLDLSHTFVTDADLWSLPGLPLQKLSIKAPYVTELRALAGLPLREVHCDFRPNRHPLTLRNLKTLQTINDTPVLDFWRAHDARRLGLKAWVKRTAALPPQEQLACVTAKLRELNPGFTEKLFETLEDGAVVGVQVFVNNVTDLAPLRAFTRLKQLKVIGAPPGRGRIYDLDPLRELPLEHLDCRNTEVADLSALAGMKLRGLRCADTFVRDLSPLRKTSLSWLDCQSTRVGELTPLKDLPLTHLYVKGCPVTDLSPLAGMPLYVLEGDFDPGRDAVPLRSIKTLASINGKPAAEFWKESTAP